MASAGFRAETSIMGDSAAIIDKETGRIFWEGGSSNTLSASFGPRVQSVVGSHFRATLLSSLLWSAALGCGVKKQGWNRWLQQRKDVLSAANDIHAYWVTVLLSFTQTLLSSVPTIPRGIVIVVAILYLLESYCCSTRKYISNTVNDVESFISDLQKTDPIVEWKVRSFIYENPFLRYWNKLPMVKQLGKLGVKLLAPIRNNSTKADDTVTHTKAVTDNKSPSLFAWKFVTHVSKEQYKYKSCRDRTLTGVWKRSPFQPAPLLKVRLTKTLLLRDAKARVDYFQQQGDFLRSSIGVDQGSEFSTKITIPGYPTRLLQGGHRGRLLVYFWVSTLFGLTVPFRRWLGQRCDEVRVTVVKETGVDVVGSRWTTTSSHRNEPFILQESAAIREAARVFNKTKSNEEEETTKE